MCACHWPGEALCGSGELRGGGVLGLGFDFRAKDDEGRVDELGFGFEFEFGVGIAVAVDI